MVVYFLTNCWLLNLRVWRGRPIVLKIAFPRVHGIEYSDERRLFGVGEFGELALLTLQRPIIIITYQIFLLRLTMVSVLQVYVGARSGTVDRCWSFLLIKRRNQHFLLKSCVYWTVRISGLAVFQSSSFFMVVILRHQSLRKLLRLLIRLMHTNTANLILTTKSFIFWILRMQGGPRVKRAELDVAGRLFHLGLFWRLFFINVAFVGFYHS